jgi:hypothetical protein
MKYFMPRRRRIAYVFYGFFYGAICLLSISDFSPSGLLGWLALPLLGYGSFHFLRAGISSKPRFEMSDDGFVDRTFMGGGDLRLNWDEIQDLRWTTLGGRLEAKVEYPAKVRKRAGWPRRFWMSLGALYGKKTVSILPTSSGPNIVELEPLIEARLFEYERSQLGFSASNQELICEAEDGVLDGEKDQASH